LVTSLWARQKSVDSLRASKKPCLARLLEERGCGKTEEGFGKKGDLFSRDKSRKGRMRQPHGQFFYALRNRVSAPRIQHMLPRESDLYQGIALEVRENTRFVSGHRFSDDVTRTLSTAPLGAAARNPIFSEAALAIASLACRWQSRPGQPRQSPS
jgi:hypothetical protein